MKCPECGRFMKKHNRTVDWPPEEIEKYARDHAGR